MIQIRNVPDDVHRTLKARAAEAGLSLSDYIKRDLERDAAGPTMEELQKRVAARGASAVETNLILDSLGEVRGR